MRKGFAAALPVAALLAAAGMAGSAAAQGGARAVDLELVMAVDDSASITGGDLEFQLRGHAAAFRDGAIVDAIARGPHHAIAVTLVKWSSPHTLATIVPWTLVGSADEAHAFADAVMAAPRDGTGGSTAIGSAIDDSAAQFPGNGFDSPRRVVDLCSNGFNNSGADPEGARDRVTASGVTVNALVILDDYDWLEGYFAESVIGGPGAFVHTAEDRDSFARALLGKLVEEISVLPVRFGSKNLLSRKRS